MSFLSSGTRRSVVLDFEVRFYSSNNFKRRLFKNIFRGGNKLILSICTFFWICRQQSFLTSVLKLFLGSYLYNPGQKIWNTKSTSPPSPPPLHKVENRSSFPKLRLLTTLHGDEGTVLSMPKNRKCSKFFFTGAVAHFRLFYLIFLYHLSSQNFKRTNFKDGFQNLKQASMCNSRLTLAGYVR